MGKKASSLIATFSAALQRMLLAIEKHTHPDLAKSNHNHEDLAPLLSPNLEGTPHTPGLRYIPYIGIPIKDNDPETILNYRDLVAVNTSALLNNGFSEKQTVVFGEQNNNQLIGLKVPSAESTNHRQLVFNNLDADKKTLNSYYVYNNFLYRDLSTTKSNLWSFGRLDSSSFTVESSNSSPNGTTKSLQNFKDKKLKNTTSYLKATFNDPSVFNQRLNPGYENTPYWVEEFRFNPGFVTSARKHLFSCITSDPNSKTPYTNAKQISLTIYGNSSTISNLHRNCLTLCFDTKRTSGTIERYEILFKNTKTLFGTNDNWNNGTTLISNKFAHIFLVFEQGVFKLYLKADATDSSFVSLTTGNNLDDFLIRKATFNSSSKKWGSWTIPKTTDSIYVGTNSLEALCNRLTNGEGINLNFDIHVPIFNSSRNQRYYFSNQVDNLVRFLRPNSIYAPARLINTQGAIQEIGFTKFTTNSDIGTFKTDLVKYFFDPTEGKILNNKQLVLFDNDDGEPDVTGDIALSTGETFFILAKPYYFYGSKNWIYLETYQGTLSYQFPVYYSDAYLHFIEGAYGLEDTLSDFNLKTTTLTISPNKLVLNEPSNAVTNRCSLAVHNYMFWDNTADSGYELKATHVLKNAFGNNWTSLATLDIINPTYDLSLNEIELVSGGVRPTAATDAIYVKPVKPRGKYYPDSFTLILTGRAKKYTAFSEGSDPKLRPILSCIDLDNNTMGGLCLTLNDGGLIELRRSNNTVATMGTSDGAVDINTAVNNFRDVFHNGIESPANTINRIGNSILTLDASLETYFYIELIFTGMKTGVGGGGFVKIRSMSSTNPALLSNDLVSNYDEQLIKLSDAAYSSWDKTPPDDNWTWVIGGPVTVTNASTLDISGLSIPDSVTISSFVEYPYDIDIVRNFYSDPGRLEENCSMGLSEGEIDFVVNTLPSIADGSHTNKLKMNAEEIIPATLYSFDKYIDPNKETSVKRNSVESYEQHYNDDSGNPGNVEVTVVNSVTFNSDDFYANNATACIEIGHLEFDSQGIVTGDLYALKERFSTDWLPVDVDDQQITIKHQIGYKNNIVEVLFCKDPDNVNEPTYAVKCFDREGSNVRGVYVSDLTPYAITLKLGTQSIVPDAAINITSGYIKVIMKRQF